MFILAKRKPYLVAIGQHDLTNDTFWGGTTNSRPYKGCIHMHEVIDYSENCQTAYLS